MTELDLVSEGSCASFMLPKDNLKLWQPLWCTASNKTVLRFKKEPALCTYWGNGFMYISCNPSDNQT